MSEYLNVKFKNLTLTGYDTDYIIRMVDRKKNFYEIEILDKWYPYIKDSDHLFDVGANLGNHSVYWAEKNPGSVIYAYEPYKENYALLRKNIEDNNIKNVVTFEKGVGKHTGYLKLKEFDENNYGRTKFVESLTPNESVSMTSIDIEAINNNCSSVDFVKIDTEGFEVEVLCGMEYVLENYHPIVWVECNEKTIREVIHILHRKGYEIVDIEGANVLFSSRSDHPKMCKEDILYQRFLYLSKTNTYYGQCIQNKEIFEKKQKELEEAEKRSQQISHNLDDARIKYRKSVEYYGDLKQELNRERENSKEKIGKYEEIIRNLSEEIKCKGTEASNACQELETISYSLEEEKKKNRELYEEHKNICEEFENEKKENERKKDLYEQLLSRSAKLNEIIQKELERERENSKEKEGKIESIKIDLKKALEDINKKKTDLVKAKAEIERLSLCLEETKRKWQKAAERLGELKQESSREKKEYRNEHERQECLLREATGRINDGEIALNEARKRVEDYNNKCEAYEIRLANQAELLKETAMVLYDNESILSETLEELNDRDRRLADMNARIIELSTRFEETQRILENDERKLTIINSHWYGRAGIRLYRFLKKIQIFLRSKGLWIERKYTNK